MSSLKAATGGGGGGPAPPRSPLKQRRATDDRSLVDDLQLLPRQIRALGGISDCHTAARVLADKLFCSEKQSDVLSYSVALSALCKDYNGIAREIFGILERYRRTLGRWIHTLNAASEVDVDALCVQWDAVLTVLLELACRHGHIMGQLALDADVYKRLSAEVLASRCYEPGETAGSRTQLIYCAMEACESQPELTQRLAPILQKMKSEREEVARSAGASVGDGAQSPMPSLQPAEDWVMTYCRDEWSWLEGGLDRFTTALFDLTLTLCRLRTKLKAQSQSKKEPPSLAVLGRIWQQVQDVCLTTAVVNPTADQSLLNRAPSKLAETFTEDPHLRPYLKRVIDRYTTFQAMRLRIDTEFGGMDAFSRAYERFGFSASETNPGEIIFREWCPGAESLSLVGEFNDWDPRKNPAVRKMDGDWEVKIPPRADGSAAIPAGSRVRISIVPKGGGAAVTRIPAWIERAEQPNDEIEFVGVYVPPEQQAYTWKHPRPSTPKALRIYEAHVGIASDELKVASYKNFTTNVLPRIAAQGYNSVQLMAIMEHAYYGSFGYQVTNFFAASSRFGPMIDLCELIDTAHGLGLVVLLDVVHSHASKNVVDGLNMFDGTDACYFHGGPRGNHPLWDSRLFNYSSPQVLRFLLSNLRWYMEQFHFDGFRFDGVTSMLYHHHGCGKVFTNYDDYFGMDTDVEAEVYLMLANLMVHSVNPGAVTVAEEVSGMPLLCRPLEYGGFGFDYRLAMAVPDYWIKTLKEKKDEDWDMEEMVHVLINRRYKEPVIAYAESHDQALVGDKTLAFWLMDKEMYTHMSTLSDHTPLIERGIAMHKLLRMITHTLAGEGYLNFIGNEFGHPEWLDFPRKENGESYHYCRRQWKLVDDELLRYKFLNEFDKRLNAIEQQAQWLQAPQAFVSLKHNGDKLVVFDRASCVFIFNFHVSKSFADYKIGCAHPGKYKVLLCTDDVEFGGQGRVSASGEYFSTPTQWHNRPHSLQIYVPSRCALILTVAQ